MIKLIRNMIVASAMLSVAGGVDSCKKSNSADRHIIHSEENPRFGLSVVFYGREIRLDDGSHQTITEYLSVKDQRSGTEVRYTPIDPSSLSSSGGFFQKVWSPDDSLLILPLGRFEGFSITNSAEVMTRLANSSFNDTVRVQLKSGVRLWHEFRGWVSPTEFDFGAGLSGQLVPFRYSVLSRKIVSRDPAPGDFVGVTSRGEIQIQSLLPATK